MALKIGEKRFKEEWNKGTKVEEMAKIFNCSNRTIKNRREMYKLKKRTRGRRKLILMKEEIEERKERTRKRQKRYKEENKEKAAKWQKSWRDKNKEKVSIIAKKYRRKNKDKIAEQQKKYRKNLLEEWKIIIQEKLGSLSCSKCGYNKNFAAIDFHSDEDHLMLGPLLQQKPTPERVAELDKGILLCSNCHREFHHPLESDS